MSHGHYPGLARGPLFVLTSAAGVTCCEASPPAMAREIARFHLPPVSVAHWVLVDRPTMHGGWEKKEGFTWPS